MQQRHYRYQKIFNGIKTIVLKAPLANQQSTKNALSDL